MTTGQNWYKLISMFNEGEWTMTANTGQDLTFGQRFIHRLKPFTANFFVLAILSLSITAPASAQPATCDPKYWDSIKAKAWTEAEREIEQNQNYIYKADSVLEYTCFDKFLSVLAGNTVNLFSETTRWGAIQGPNMQQALQNLVGASLQAYITTNFPRSYLGDFSSLGYDVNPVQKATNYDCDQIKQVWKAAKCQDFANQGTDNGKAKTSTNTDFFYMSTYNGKDYRQYPAWATCAPAGNWGTLYPTSINSDKHYPKEKYDTYLNFFNGAACDGGGNGTPVPKTIPTGVTVKRQGTQDYPEIICVVAGCASNKDGTACTKTGQ